jgi:hypothetical protein
MAAAEEAEVSERSRRPRGRPRREPLTDHGRSSSRDFVHDDDLQHTVDGDGVHGRMTRRQRRQGVPLPLVHRSPTSEVPRSSRSDLYLLRGAH